DGRGTRVEINPVNQSAVDRKHQRDLSSRSVNVRDLDLWDRAVDAWMDDDLEELDAVWDEIIEDLGSDYDAYSNVSSIGWAA
ncbi:transcriptional regulator, partial [Streptomyces cyaneofuscatus]